LEFGASYRSYWWKRRLFDYRNVDVASKSSEMVDIRISNGRLESYVDEVDIVLISHVFGEITDKTIRARIINVAAQTCRDTGGMVFFDDLDLGRSRHLRLTPGKYFHRQRLGTDLLNELSDGGWTTRILTRSNPNRIKAEHELPFIVCQKALIDPFTAVAANDLLTLPW